MNKEDLNLWKTNPTTVKVLHYLDDYVMMLAKSLATTDFAEKSEAYVAREQAHVSGIVSMVEHLASLEFEDVDKFYNPEKEEDDEEV